MEEERLSALPFAGDPIVPFAVVDFPSFHFCSWRSAASCEREGRKEETVRGEERGGPEEDATYYSCRPGASPMAPSEKMDGLRMRQRERERAAEIGIHYDRYATDDNVSPSPIPETSSTSVSRANHGGFDMLPAGAIRVS